MQMITVHRPDCPQMVDGADGLHVAIKDMGGLVDDVYNLMKKNGIPFYLVQPHSSECPGSHFPWEDLELRLFTLEH